MAGMSTGAASVETTMAEASGAQRYAGRSHDAYRRALRHSVLVRTLKFFFPLAAVLIVAGFIAASVVRSALPDNFSVDRTAIEGGKLVMNNPVLTGQTEDGGLYKLTAVRAIQELSKPDVIHLEDIAATLPFGGDQTASIKASSAAYDRSRDVITFDKPFEVTTGNGLAVKFGAATVDVKTGKLASDEPIDVKTPQGGLVARSARISDNGKTIQFEDRVRMTLSPSTLNPEQRKEDEAK